MFVISVVLGYNEETRKSCCGMEVKMSKTERRSLNEIIKLSDEQKKQLGQEVRAFYLDVRGEEIGLIEEQQIIDLFCEHMAPVIYNRALDDAQYFFKKQMDNLEADYYLLYKNIR